MNFSTVPPGTPPPSPPPGPTHPTPTRPGEPAPPKNRLGDYEWGAHKPEEVARQGRAAVTSSSSLHPAAPGGVRLDIGHPRDGVTAVAAREAEALRGADADVRVGRVAVPAASTLPTHRLANERLRGAW
jgi:hypothetical protein